MAKPVKRGRGRPPEPVRVNVTVCVSFRADSKGDATRKIVGIQSAFKGMNGAVVKADIVKLGKPGRPRKDAA